MKNINSEQLKSISGGGCTSSLLWGLGKGAASGAIAGSGVFGIGAIGGAVIGGNVGLVGGALKCT